MAAVEQKSLIGRYRLLDLLLARLGELKEEIVQNLTARSPLERHPDAEQNLRDRWEDELTASIEAEYRRQRGDVLSVVQWWLRDVWLQTLTPDSSEKGRRLLRYPWRRRCRQANLRPSSHCKPPNHRGAARLVGNQCPGGARSRSKFTQAAPVI